MVRSLAKVQKKIHKKQGNARSLHENSRHAKKLRRAELREDKLTRLHASRSKASQPLLEMVSFFQEAAQRIQGSLEGVVHELIESYLHRHDERFSDMKKQRRSGQSSYQEDLLKLQVSNEERLYEESGFYMPDLKDVENLERLRSWNGDWTALNGIKFVHVRRDGTEQDASFPPNRLS
ncbi:MAG: hypothetical protein M1816_003753 [Peltula sp. TS41687]|nr:MAG: hypothetical protein M1816_003753 [Peltula sp. TS41687]